MEKRAALESALSQLRLTHPAVPHLRDFQVTHRPFQANYVSCSPWPLTFLNNKTSDGHLRERLRWRWSPPHHVRSPNWIRQKYADDHAWSPIASRCGLPNFRLRCTLYLNRVHNTDCGPAYPNRDSAARGLPEIGFNSPCWQPGVKYIQMAPSPPWSKVKIQNSFKMRRRHILWFGHNLANRSQWPKLSQRPQILVCNVEFLASKKVVKSLN